MLAAGTAAGLLVATGALIGFSRLAGDDSYRSAAPAPVMVQESVVDHVYDGDYEFYVGGGVAVFDCDADLQPELYLAGGVNEAGLYLNRSAVGGTLGFERLRSPVTDLTDVTGAYPLDVDSDGLVDLAVLRLGENVMLRGVGDCVFERANETWGVDGGDEWTTAFSATWREGETLPSLAFGNYRASADGEWGDCDDSYLHAPEGDTYGGRTALSPGWCTLSILFSDWGRNGHADLRLTNDRHYYVDGEEQLWDMSSTSPRLFGRDDGWELLQIWGMGIASHDLTGDDLPEVYLTSQGDNKLQTLADGPELPTFTDMALAAGATAHRPFTGETDKPSTAWHAEFDDVNNDGFMDLFVAKGNVEAQAEFAAEDPNNLLLGQPDGIFVEGAEAAGLLDFDRSRGAAVADLNMDGLLDVVVVERRVPVRIWRNTGPADGEGRWVAIGLEQPAPNRDGIGSWIEVRAGGKVIEREVVVGGGHAGGQLGWTHFGLGETEEVEVRVIWPDGERGPWQRVDADGFWVVERDDDPLRWDPLAD